MAFSFVVGTPAALDSGDGSVSLVAAMVMAIVQLVRGRTRALAGVTLLITLAPVPTVIPIAVVARTSV